MLSSPPIRRCAFGPITVEYDERVLTPREWTLGQSVWAAELARDRAPAGQMLELCAGAGHIGLAAAVLAGSDSGWGLVQVERDPVAAAYAAANARQAGWSERVSVRNAPMESALEAHERFGLIVADPPYLPSVATSRWPEDPISAIDGGSDGLVLVRVCLALAARHLEPGGSMLLQMAGPGQIDAISAILEPDLQIVERRVTDTERAVVRIDQRRGTDAVS